jgi:hypothetical protein
MQRRRLHRAAYQVPRQLERGAAAAAAELDGPVNWDDSVVGCRSPRAASTLGADCAMGETGRAATPRARPTASGTREAEDERHDRHDHHELMSVKPRTRRLMLLHSRRRRFISPARRDCVHF